MTDEDYNRAVAEMTGLSVKEVERYRRISIDDAVARFLSPAERDALVRDGFYVPDASSLIDELYNYIMVLNPDGIEKYFIGREARKWLLARRVPPDCRSYDVPEPREMPFDQPLAPDGTPEVPYGSVFC